MFSRSIASKNVAANNRLLLLAQIVFCSLLIALCAQIRITLPFTPVPITLQTLSVMIIGGMLGSRNGALCLLLYLAEALFGFPVLAGGRSDPLFLLSPVGGYLIGFLAQAYIAGWFVEKRKYLGKPLMLLGLAISCAAQLSCGAIWLAFFVGTKNAFMLGVAPFIAGELLKVIAAAAFFKRYI